MKQDRLHRERPHRDSRALAWGEADFGPRFRASLILTLAALFGCMRPLVRAARVDPAVALRHD
jgi:hypothetical protein